MSTPAFQPDDAHKLHARLTDVEQRYRFTCRVLLSTLDLLPTVRPHDAPRWLRRRILELADDAQRLEDAANETRERIAQSVTPMS